MKVTVKASSDLALVKYWGKRDEALRIPENGSVSMILNGLDTITTVEFDSNLADDQITIEGEMLEVESSRVKDHLNLIREKAQISDRARVVSKNSFPKGTGLSSSGSGFAALTMAASKAAGLEPSEKELSILARMGSGTACRCVCGGFVEWLDGDTSDSSYSRTLYPASHWYLRDVVAVVDEGPKQISSTEGHKSARSSLFYPTRLKHIPAKIQSLKRIIADKDFSAFGELIEAEALEFHSILLTSIPPLVAWYPGTIQVMRAVQRMRAEGIEAYFSINTGFNVHVVTLPKYEHEVRHALEELDLVKKTIVTKVGEKPKYLKEHLF